MEVNLYFEKGGERNYACVLDGDTGTCGFIGYGSTARIAESDIDVEREEYAEMGHTFPPFEVKSRHFDIGSFFDYYPLNITQFAKFAGINASQLRQYVSGQRTPSKKTTKKIENAVRALGNIFVNDSCALGIDCLLEN